MAKLSAVLDSLDGVEDAVRGFYTKGGDEKFYLDLDGTIDSHPAKLPVVRKNAELLSELRTAKERAKLIEGIDDVEGMKAAAARVAELEEQIAKGGKGAAEIEKLQREHQRALEAIRTQTQQQIENANATATAKEKAAREYFHNGEITRALAANGGDPDMIAHFIHPRTKVIEDDVGNFVRLAVLDDSGNERVKDSKLTPVSVDDFVGELRTQEKWGGAFKASGKSGSGADALGGGGGGGGGVVRSENGIVRADPTKILSGETRVAAS